MTAMSDRGPEEFLARGDRRGHLVESAVGAYLIARSECEGFEVMWWREGNKEVDFVIRSESALTAIEVKGGAESGQSGMASFLDEHPEAKRLVVGGADAGVYGRRISRGRCGAVLLESFHLFGILVFC